VMGRDCKHNASLMSYIDVVHKNVIYTATHINSRELKFPSKEDVYRSLPPFNRRSSPLSTSSSFVANSSNAAISSRPARLAF
jgi:hypothetical protein